MTDPQTREAPPTRPPHRPRRWSRAFFASSLGSLVAFGLSGGFSEPATWALRGKVFLICVIYGWSMGLAALFVIPSWLRRLARRDRLSWWISRVLALPLVIFCGGMFGAGLLILLGLVPPSTYLQFLFPYTQSWPTLVMVAVIFLAVTSYEYLRERLDRTALALRTKERDEAEARRIAAEAQLASLESRVHPHFLFNTLNSIAALIPEDPAGAERMTGQLASLLRSSLDSAAAPLIPLEQELHVVRDYLDIERVRFGQRLQFHIDVDRSAYAWHIPRLSVQTLVENSVKYAVAPRRDGGVIRIAATATDARLRIEVADDGPGFDEQRKIDGHGLALVENRLRMSVGDAARLVIERRSGQMVVGIEIFDTRLRHPDVVAESA